MRRLWYWISERFWAGLLLMVVGVMAVSLTLVEFVIMPTQEARQAEFNSDYQNQGGRLVELDNNTYCIIDGVKIIR